jgi:hypothetical protein
MNTQLPFKPKTKLAHACNVVTNTIMAQGSTIRLWRDGLQWIRLRRNRGGLVLMLTERRTL